MAHKGTNCMTDTVLLLSGGIIGAGMALLLAPQAGRKTREDLASYAKTMKGRANEAASDFAESINGFATSVAARSAEIMESGEELTQESKKELLAALEKGQEHLEKLKNRLSESIG